MCTFAKCVFENTIERKLLDELDGIVEKQKIQSIEIRENSESKVNKYNLEELHAELDRLNYSWQKGRIKSAEEYDRKYDLLVQKIEAANEELAEERKEPDFSKIESVLVDGWQNIYESLDDEHRRAFWRSFISEIHINWEGNTKEIKEVIFF